MFELLMALGIGAIAGLVANRLSPSTMNLSLSVLLGIAGALIGDRIGDVLEISRFGNIFEPVGALLGSIFVLIGWRQSQVP